tara:strand:- start:935 stop:1237 length:303 start_codon:yes stop_codon:yes gene_type:complete
MPSEKYRVPVGARIKPSQIGHYNYWYPHEEKEYVSDSSFMCERMMWRGSDNWEAVLVTVEDAKAYQSPIRVVWVEKSLFNDMAKAPYIREQLKKRADDGK